MRALLLAGCCILLVATPASIRAQQFRVGQWGVEAPITGSSGTLLKFNDPAAAWLIGADLTFERIEFDGGGPTATTHETTLLNLRLGRRWYQPPSGPLRPFSSLGISGGVGRGAGAAGVFGEFGVSYFLNDRLNLGAVGLLTVEYMESESLGGASIKQTIARIAGPRMLVGFLF